MVKNENETNVAEGAGMGKRPLPYEALRDVIDLSLWAGQLLLQHGAESQRVEETVHRLGTHLGCDWMDILVSPSVIVVTTHSGYEFRTKTRRVVRMGANLWTVTAVNRLSRRVQDGELDRFQVRSELERISSTPSLYPHWLVVLMVGLACAAFSQLFGGGWTAFAVTFCASAAAMITRLVLTKQYFNSLLVVVISAFVAELIAGGAVLLSLSSDVEITLVASVLLLVPGVHLINSVEDLILGYPIIGMARGMMGFLISMAIAIGILFALRLLGLDSL